MGRSRSWGTVPMVMLLILWATATTAQQVQNGTNVDTSATVAPVPKGTATEMDTSESLMYMGRKLLFEVRRRLNLTTEREEQEQKETQRQFKLKLGSLEVKKGIVEK